MSKSKLHQLADHGQSIWIDYLSRRLMRQGELERMMREDAVAGVTSNPTIFQKAIAEGDAYDEQLAEILAEEADAKEIFLQLAARDVQDACDLLRPVWDEGKGQDGYVSMEVDPTLAYDREGSYAETKRFHEWIDRPNLLVKIPATQPGLGAIEDSIAAGRAINITLIFSLERYREVVEAYLRGLERLVAAGGNPTTVASVASFFVSRVDTEADKRLEAVGSEEALALRGKLAVANAKLAYEHFEQAFSGERWEYLASKGASKQRCLGLHLDEESDYRDVVYVEELIGPLTVNTMPQETIQAFQDHGEVALTLTQGREDARQVFADLERVGVDYDDVTGLLEEEGVQKFAASFEELLDGVRAKRGELAAK